MVSLAELAGSEDKILQRKHQLILSVDNKDNVHDLVVKDMKYCCELNFAVLT